MTTEPMSREAILRRNIAALEVALRTQTERANDARKIAMQTWIAERDLWMERAEAAEAKLEKAREQKPVTAQFLDGGFETMDVDDDNRLAAAINAAINAARGAP